MTSASARADWIDLHTHILPGMDDGADDMAQAVAMARMAEKEGIGCLVATPHNVDWPARDQRPTVAAATQALRDALLAAGVQLTLLPGVEAYLDPDICEQVRRGRAFPLAGSRTILVELPASGYLIYTERVIFDLQVMGLSVILAHPERNAQLQSKPDQLVPLAERGVLMQVTAGSITGRFGPAVQHTAHYLLRSRLAHVIASDAHDDNHRPPALAEAVAVASELVGEEQALAMVSSRPRAILNDEPVEIAPPVPAREEKRSFWGRLFARGS